MLEEINDDDIDNMDFDPADFDPQNIIGSSAYDSKNGPARLVSKTAKPPSTTSSARQPTPDEIMAQFAGGNPVPSMQNSGNSQAHFIQGDSEMEEFKHWSVLYPCYFDAQRTHKEGRRVNKEHAVANPQAQTMMHALRELCIPAILEATKTHPKDWANTGRVRYLLKDKEITELRQSEGLKRIQDKRHLLLLVSDFLKKHPTTKETPFESPVFQQLQQARGYNGERLCEPLAVPRGWKINEILPVISPAITGGEAPENMMEQMSKSMFGGMMDAPQAPAMPKKPKRINIRK